MAWSLFVRRRDNDQQVGVPVLSRSTVLYIPRGVLARRQVNAETPRFTEASSHWLVHVVDGLLVGP